MYSALTTSLSSTLNAEVFSLLDMRSMKTLAERVKWCFDNAEEAMSITKRAEELDVTRHTIYLWKNGTTKHMTPDVCRRVADHFGVSRDWLETGEGSAHPEAATTLRQIAAEEVVGTYTTAGKATATAEVIRAELAQGDTMQVIKRAFKKLGIIDGREKALLAEIEEAAAEAEAYRLHWLKKAKGGEA